MAAIDRALLDLKRLDLLATGSTALHRLDARAKVVTTLVFIVSVVSFGKYEVSALIPFFVFPAVVIALADLPARYIAGKVALVCPFALAVAIFNPLFDRGVLLQIGGLSISGGVVSCLSILLRTALTVSAVIVLIAVTGFPALCRSMERLGMPKVFSLQILFLYRYLMVLTEEGRRVSMARDLRSFGNRGLGMASYSSLLGHLLLRTGNRAGRVHMAMLSRGFTGAFPASAQSVFGLPEAAFLLGWSALFIALRLNNASLLLGSLLTGLAG